MCRSKANGGRRCSGKNSASRTPKVNSNIPVDENIDSSTWQKYGFYGSDEVRKGLGSVEQSRAFLAPFEREGEEWRYSLDMEEQEAVNQYSMGSFEYINAYLRDRSTYEKMLTSLDDVKQDSNMKDQYDNFYQSLITSLLPAVRKSRKVGDQPYKLYRYIEAPQGVNGHDFVHETYKVGQTVSDKGFMSTSLDSDCMVMMGTASHRNTAGAVVFEILTEEGAVLHEYEENYSSIQSDEREVLVPAGQQFEIVGIQENVTFETSRELKSMQRRNNTAKSLKTTVVQLVDKKLIK